MSYSVIIIAVSPSPTVCILHSAEVHASLKYVHMNRLQSLKVSEMQVDSVPEYFSIQAVKFYPQI